jgi:outer membrane receptor protein involved in Fe transport
MTVLPRRDVGGVALLAAMCVLVTGLYPPPLPAQDEDDVGTIFVTARKRVEALQDVPVAVSAFDEQQFENRQIRTIDDIARFTPGLSFAKAFGRTTERPVIRGLGNVLAGVQFGVESGAAYFIDGVYYPGDIQSINIESLERVEVLRGPQSALYGRNTYAGAINFVSKTPPETFEGSTKISYGEDSDVNATVTIGGELTEDLTGTLSGRYYSFDGEYTNAVTGETIGDEETTSLSGMVELQASENVRLRARLNFQRDRDGTRAFFLQPSEMNNCYPGTRSNAAWAVTGSTNNNQYYCGDIERRQDWVALNDGPAIATHVVPGIPDTPFPGATPAPTDDLDPYNPVQGVAFSGVQRDLFYMNAIADWDMGGSGWTLTTALAFRDDDRLTGSDSDQGAMNLLPGGPGTECLLCASETDHFKDYSLEMRLASPVDRRFRWMAGGFLYEQDIDGSDVTFSQPRGGQTNEMESTENWAAFGLVEFDITDALTARIEGRYFDEEKSLWQNETVNPTTIPLFADTVDFSEFAPKLLVNWDVTEDMLLYASYAKGYKPGGLNGKPGIVAANPAPTYGQEESDNFEVGFKSTLFDDRLVANIAVFFIDVTDIQLTTPLTTGSGQLTSIVTNQGSGEVTGAEVELQYLLTDGWTIGANYALADTEFTEGCDEFQWTLTSGGGLLNDFANCSGNDVNGSGNGSIEGNHFPLSSKNQVSAYTDFRRPFGADYELILGADVSWEDRKPVQVHNLAWVPEATIVNARIGVETGRWTAAVYGRNLTDEDAPAMVTRWLQDPLVFGIAGFPSTAAAGAPPGSCPPGTCSTTYPRGFFADMRRGRNLGLEIIYRFGGE